MAMNGQSAAAAAPTAPAVAHAMQKNRQAYLARLKAQTDHKMTSLRQEADRGVEGEETLQMWLADQLFESANHLSLQFTESVVARAWERIQSYKLEQLKAVIRPSGKDEMVRNELRNTATAVL